MSNAVPKPQKASQKADNNIGQQTNQNIIIKIACADKTGIVFAIAKTLYDAGCNIVRLQEHVEPAEGCAAESAAGSSAARFFARVECTGAIASEKLRDLLAKSLSSDAQVQVHRQYKKDIVLLATTEYHCAADIILRAMHEEINASVRAVVANREVLRDLSEALGVPFYYVPVEDGMSREAHEAALRKTLARHEHEYLVMARYMRVLSGGFIRAYQNRIINIHHSFLPAFAGANPYRQAHERGVKIIGATAHFATEDLDEGPIITQNVIPIDHSYDLPRMKNAGRDAEKVTLARALELVCEDRVFVSGNKTIVL